MATRSIVTSQPDVVCDVCGRRLLRGEHPDVFLAGGQRRMVCELCAPRAAHQGWLREADSHSLSLRPPRGRSARSLLGRLRQLREPVDGVAHPGTRAPRSPAGSEDELESELYDFLDGAHRDEGEDMLATHDEQPEPELVTSGELKIARALEVFNAGEQPRRVAGVSRSLGAPSVTVRPLADSGSRVAIVVAWELCWYRYEVDLGDALAGPQLLARGTELDELSEEDRLVNAAADERGELAVLG
jgi:hypothetical protein